MTVKQALKQKNTLVKKINEDINKVRAYNSVDEGNVRPYSTKELLNRVMETNKELVDLKTKIHLANASVYHKIFELSELKNTVSFLKSVDCSEGKVTDRYSRSQDVYVKVAELSVVERDNLVEGLENRIEILQEELDEHNSKTHI
jgi:hypothetical protein